MSHWKSLLVNSSALTAATALAVLTPVPALACVTVSSDTTISNSISCIAWDSNNITITGSGSIGSPHTAVLNSTGNAVGNITNSGIISATYVGVFDAPGTIGTVTNDGTINAPYGVATHSPITAVFNSGTIISSVSAIRDNGGTIGTVSNSGTLSSDNGIFNNSTIGTINNTGLLSNSNVGIANGGGTISIISNNLGGTISGGNSGISNSGTGIGLITNDGTISGGPYGIRNNTGTIGTIINSMAGYISGSDYAIENLTTISTISNLGTLSGASAIYNYGTTGTINNSGTINGTVGIEVSAGSISEIINGSGGFIHGSLAGLAFSEVNVDTILNASGGTIYNGQYGIATDAIMGTLINNGFISGQSVAVYDIGTLASLVNTGTIYSPAYGIANNGATIGTIINSGLISAPTAIISNSTILSAVSNSGTIAGNINVTQALTITGGSVGTLGTLTGYNGAIGTITTTNNNLTFDTNAYQLLDDDINVGASNTAVNQGYVRLNTTHSITGNYSQTSGATLAIGVTDSTHYGQLIVSGAALMTNGQVLITPTSGSLSSGESFTIVQALAAGTSYSGVTGSANGFTVSSSSIASGSNEDLILTLATVSSGGGGNSGGAPVTYAGVGQQSGGTNGAAVGTVLDQIEADVANGNNKSFASILSSLNIIGSEQGSVAEGNAIKQLAPGQLSAGVTGNNFTASQSMMVIGQHQQNLHSGGEGFGRSSGSEYTSGALWMQVDGGFANSTAAGAGFHQSYYGLTFGIDDHLSSNAVLGMAFGWAHNGAQGSNSLSGDTVTTSTPELMGYGTYKMGRAYVDAMLGVGYNMFNQNRTISFLNSVATSSYGGMQYMGDVETGYDIPLDAKTTLTPLIGFNAVRTDTNGYTESGAGAADTLVGQQIIDSYATGLGGRVSTAIPTAWGSLLPDIKLSWMHDLNHSPISSNATLAGVNFTTSTPRTAQDGAEISLGTTLEQSDALSLRAEYDGDIRTDFQAHTGMLKGEWKF